jgi:hypothetical protein
VQKHLSFSSSVVLDLHRSLIVAIALQPDSSFRPESGKHSSAGGRRKSARETFPKMTAAMAKVSAIMVQDILGMDSDIEMGVVNG